MVMEDRLEQAEKAWLAILVKPVKYCNSSKDWIVVWDLNTEPRSVTAAASTLLSFPSLFVSQLATQIALTLASTKLMIESSSIVTITLHVAVRFVPSVVVAVMTAEPFAFEVTIPASLTVATEVLLLVHVTFLFVALKGVIVAVSVAV